MTEDFVWRASVDQRHGEVVQCSKRSLSPYSSSKGPSSRSLDAGTIARALAFSRVKAVDRGPHIGLGCALVRYQHGKEESEVAVRPIILTREAQEARLLLLVTALRWEKARPAIGRTLMRRRTRVSELRQDGQVCAVERVTHHGTDLRFHIRPRHRVRRRARG